MSKLDFNIFTDNYTYQRNVNHVTADLEKRLAGMYGAKRVFLTNSCMEAISILFDYLLPNGGKVIINKNTYYETRQWLKMSKRFEVVELDFSRLSIFTSLEEEMEIREIIKDASVFYLDYPSFFMKFYDLQEILSFVKSVNAKLITDNTVLSLYYTNPIKIGVDYVVESYSKYVAGHGDVMAGGIVCKDEPEDEMKVFVGRRGCCVSAMTVFLLERSLETLDVRMKKHTENGRFISENLNKLNVKNWYSGYGGCIIFPGKGEEFCDKLSQKGHFKKCPTFGTTFSTTSFVRSPDLYDVKSYARISCGLEDKVVLWDDIYKSLYE